MTLSSFRAGWTMLCALLLAPLPLSARAAPAPAAATVPQAQCDCFQMQFLLRLPSLEGLHFISDVSALQKDMEAGKPPTPARIAGLRQEADTLRRKEEDDYGRLMPLLATMGAPKTVKSWVSQCDAQLAQPVVMSSDERQDAKTDPDTAAILATIDECDSLKNGTDALMPDVAAWVHVAYGGAGIWAADVGEMTASLQVSVAAGQAARLATNLPGSLSASAPAGTPSDIRTALTILVPPSGNLSGLTTATSNIPLATATQARDALLAGFAATGLADLTPAAPSS